MILTITGASGFVGQRLIEACRSGGVSTRTVSLRDPSVSLPEGDTLVHLAAIAHSGHTDEDQVFAVNRDLAISVAMRARNVGYRRFLFLSSALVWGSDYESVDLSTPERPDNAYGHAKLEAEEALHRLESPDFRVTVLRPPLVYGPGVKGNLAKLLQAVQRWPVCPLGSGDNQRSLLHVDNLAAAIIHLARIGTSGRFCPFDSQPISSLEILTRMAANMPSHGRVMAMPRWARWTIRQAFPGAARRLFGSFVVTDDSLQRTGFVPPLSMDDGFEKMVRAFLQRRARHEQK
jgi:nucleoside-diphosphate-sugar epimerase